jgi:hypothetical protein
MPNTYHWTFPAIQVYPSQFGHANVVYVVHWNLEGRDETQAFTSNRYGMQQVAPYVSGSEFVPYENLTPAIVAGWVTSSMGDEVYGAITASINERIAALQAPTFEVLPPPWPESATGSL